MAGRGSIDERMRRVRELRDEADSAKLRAGLSKALADSSNLVAGEAAKIIGDLERSGFEQELLRSYERFLVEPLKSDKGCAAKGPIVETLGKLDYDDVDFYQAGLKYTQFEPVWGGSEDTAGNVRGACAFALARSHQLRTITKLLLFVDLLDSSFRLDRVHAVQAMADTGSESALPLLKLKLACGDEHAEVLGACMAGMLRLDPAVSIPAIAAALDAPDDDVVIEAAAVLGECGQDAAVDALIAKTSRTRDRELLPSLLGSLGLSRNPRAVGFLLAKIEGDGQDSLAALNALRPVMVYAELREKARQAVEKTGNPHLAKAFAKPH